MISTNVGGIELSCCIYNASGPRTYSVEALKKIAESGAGAVLAKSATLHKCDGNPLPRCINKMKLGDSYSEGSINSEGLPNSGIEHYLSEETVSVIKQYKKPYIVSLSGLSNDENLAMLKTVVEGANVDAVELNFACPNIPGKSITAYDFEQMDQLLMKMDSANLFQSRCPVGLKLPPYFDIAQFQQAALAIAKYPVRFVVTCNSIPNGLVIDVENECEGFAANHGLGGLGGGFIKHTALANVRLLSQALHAMGRDDIDIVGVGGVATGKDAFELILCGAKAVQVGTTHWTEGSKCFKRIADELQALMVLKGYTSIEDFRGKLKPYSKPVAASVGAGGDAESAGSSSAAAAASANNKGGGSEILAGKNAKQLLQLYLLSLAIVVLVLSFSYSTARSYFKL